MTDTVLQSFCERCGKRYELAEPEQPPEGGRSRLGLLKRRGGDADGDPKTATVPSTEALQSTFHFCLECRQYACPDCWNTEEGYCVGCRPPGGIPGGSDRVEHTHVPASGALASPFAAASASTPPTPTEPAAWPTGDLQRSGSAGAPAAGATGARSLKDSADQAEAPAPADEEPVARAVDEWGRPVSATPPPDATADAGETPAGAKDATTELDPWRGVVFSDDERESAADTADVAAVSPASSPFKPSPPPTPPVEPITAAWPATDQAVVKPAREALGDTAWPETDSAESAAAARLHEVMSEPHEAVDASETAQSGATAAAMAAGASVADPTREEQAVEPPPVVSAPTIAETATQQEPDVTPRISFVDPAEIEDAVEPEGAEGDQAAVVAEAVTEAAPTAEVAAPAVEVEAPAAEVEAPATEVKAPAAEAEAPTAEVEAPAAEAVTEAAPTAEVETPAAEVKAPAAEVEAPTAEVEAPAAEAVTEAAPTAEVGAPAAEVGAALRVTAQSVESAAEIDAPDATAAVEPDEESVEEEAPDRGGVVSAAGVLAAAAASQIVDRDLDESKGSARQVPAPAEVPSQPEAAEPAPPPPPPVTLEAPPAPPAAPEPPPSAPEAPTVPDQSSTPYAVSSVPAESPAPAPFSEPYRQPEPGTVDPAIAAQYLPAAEPPPAVAEAVAPVLPPATTPPPPAAPPPLYMPPPPPAAPTMQSPSPPGQEPIETRGRLRRPAPRAAAHACVNCGLPLSAQARFCRRCGSPQT